jgi:hypothetical protein
LAEDPQGVAERIASAIASSVTRCTSAIADADHRRLYRHHLRSFIMTSNYHPDQLWTG